MASRPGQEYVLEGRSRLEERAARCQSWDDLLVNGAGELGEEEDGEEDVCHALDVEADVEERKSV